MNTPGTAALRRSAGLFLWLALTVELLDELVDGVSGAAWPLIRDGLHLSYGEIGLLFSLPVIVAGVIEPGFGLLADRGRGLRSALVLGGGLCYAAALALMAGATGFWTLMLAQLLYHPAAGAFVTLTQAAWMDANPARREQHMTRWTLAGSVGTVLGPLLVGGALTLGLGWRPVYGLLAALLLLGTTGAFRLRSVLTSTPGAPGAEDESAGLSGLMAALKRGEVRRFLWLLESSNLLLDLFRGFVALYLVDVAGVTPARAALAVAVLTGVGLLGDALVVPLLERVASLPFLRVTAIGAGLSLVAFLLLPGFPAKLTTLGLIGLLTSGWYAVVQAQLYASLPERSGTVVALVSLAGLIGGLVPLGLGLVSQQFGLGAAMWLLLLGPLSLLLGLPRSRPPERV